MTRHCYECGASPWQHPTISCALSKNMVLDEIYDFDLFEQGYDEANDYPAEQELCFDD